MDPSDTTAIIDMKKNFQKFIAEKDESRKRSRLDFSETSLLDSSHASINQSYGRDPDALRVKTDLLYCKSRIGMLESQLSSRETELKEQDILHEREISELKRTHDRELRGYSILKTSHERVLHRQELCEAELREEKATLTQCKQVYDTKIQQLHKRNMEQDVAYTEMLEEQRAKCREYRNKCMSQQADLTIANSELTQLKEHLNDTKRKLNDSLSTSTESEEWKSRATQAEESLQQLQAELDRYKDDMMVMSARKRDLAKLQQVTEENIKLSSQNKFYQITVENIEVMKEKVLTMERKLKNYEELKDKLAQLEVENEHYSSRITELQSRQIPEDTVVRLREAQEKEAVMLANIGDLKSRNRLLEARVHELSNSSSTLQSRLSGAGDESEAKNKQIEKLQRKIFLLTKERDGYKKILESYESDVTRDVVAYSTDKSTQLQQTINGYTKAVEDLENELQNMEKENANLKQRLLQLTTEGEVAVQAPLDEITANKVDQSQILQLRQQIEDLEKSLEKLTEEKEILEARIEQRNLQGDYDPTKTKVVHFTMNPSAVAQISRADDVRLLSEDRKRLRERVRVLESKLADAHNVTVQVNANLNSASNHETEQLKEMKSKLASCEKRSEKMMEMFKKTSLEFRQVVYQLTGFRIDIPKTKEYKLMNMYSNSPDEYLLFQESGEGDLLLLETDYATTQTIVDLASEHLQGQGAIPVFLSSLTIELFKHSTMMTSTM